MKMKYLILLAVLTLSSVSANAQFKKWVQNQAAKIQNSPSVQRIDPEAYLKRKINENYYLNEFTRDIRYKFGQLENTINDNTTFYKRSDIIFPEEFTKSNTGNDQLVYLEDGLINEKFPVNISFANKEYNLYTKDDYFVAATDNAIPVNESLRNIIIAAYWANQTKNINTLYVTNLQSLSSYSSQFCGYMLVFYNQCIYIFDALEDMGYMGITAASLIDGYAQTHGINFSIEETNTLFKSMRSEFVEMQEMSADIYNGCNGFLETRQKLLNTKSASYEEVQESLQEFRVISADLNSLADIVQRKKREVAEKREDLQQLSSYFGINFIEDIGDLFGYLESYYQQFEDGIRLHANNFGGFADNVDQQAEQMYNKSKTAFDNFSSAQIGDEMPYLNDYVVLHNEINESSIPNLPSDAYTQYLSKVVQMKEAMMLASEIDFVSFHNAKAALREVYNEFPVEAAKTYYQGILSMIDDKQIIGGSYLEQHAGTYIAILDQVEGDKSKVKNLAQSDKALDEYYASAKSNNVIFYCVAGGVALILLSVLVFVLLKKRKKKV